MRIILASKSPRRKELLSLITNDFEVMVSDSDEIVNEVLSNKDKVISIAKQKATDVFSKVEGDVIVIGSDTFVVSPDGQILGKPKDRDDAERMLELLSDNTHEVMTGVCVLIRKNNEIREYADADITKVHVKLLSKSDIDKWINTGNAWDKAGAYAIQQEFAVHIDKIEGSFASVMGFPVHLVYDFIKDEL